VPGLSEDLARRFAIDGRVAFVTGGGGLLGPMHGLAVAGAGGLPVLADLRVDQAEAKAAWVREQSGREAVAVRCDVTDPESIRSAVREVERSWGPVDVLINNAANDPKVGGDGGVDSLTRLERFPLAQWSADLAVGLTGSFLCAQVVGPGMAERERGVILNVSSDLGVIAPDQRLYRKHGVEEAEQPVKPVTYSVVKHGLVGLTRYLATYWADRGVRANALAPGGVFQDQPRAFLDQVESRIPLGRMARVDEYIGAVAFLCSDASSYMNGAVVVMDGGRSVW
jgi:NAD(P)-dependent dehydrogenase (short-subunit alcohol dehydrogenase family)